MKKITILLLLAASPAWAGWKSLAQEPAGTSYADADTIVRDGNIAAMSSLLDYNDFQRMVEVGYFSRKVRAEYDCKERKVRNLSVSLHAQHMGEGKVIYADETPQEWQPVEPDSLHERLWKIACK
jgi:hypothetical protein